MNSSAIIKRTVPLLVILVVIIGIAVSCSVFSKDKTVPSVTPGDYLTVTEGNITYSVSKEDIYRQLKTSYGEKTLLELIDKNLLKSTVRGQSNYWDDVTSEEIDEAIENAIYPSGKENLTQSEIDEAKEKYMYNNGLRTDAELRDYQRLLLARRLYGKDKLLGEIEEADRKAEENSSLKPYFTEENYQAHYDANYKNGYWTIVLPFTSEAQATQMLNQLGYKIHKKDTSVSGDFDRWVKMADDETLSPEEVVKAFIDMYNTIKSQNVENYPVDRLTLKEGLHFTHNENKYSFITTISENDESLNELYYTNEEMIAFQRDIEVYLKRTMSSYANSTSTEITSASNWYTPLARGYNNSSLFVYMLKISEQAPPSLDDVKDEIFDKLFESKLTDNYISTEMAKLRASKDLVILDPDIENSYITTVKALKQEHKTTKDSSDKIIAKIGNTEYSADDLLNEMDRRYGMNVAYGEINFLRMLNNPTFNTIYDYKKGEAIDRNRILDADKWQNVKDAAANEKTMFAANLYSQYGFPASYGWKNFLRDVYGIYESKDIDRELLYYFLYREVTTKYASSLGDITELDENSDLWKAYQEKMEKIENEYFKVTGIHLLITVYDEKSQPIDPEEWTDYQNQLAKELYQQVWQYMRENTGENAAKFQEIADAFAQAPRFLAHLEQNVASQPVVEGSNYVFKNIEVSKYKTAGLSVKYEDLGSFTNGQMAKAFNDAVKSIWDNEIKPSTEHIPYANVPINNQWTYLVTEFGYHAYINTSTSDIAKWDVENGKVIPTMQMVKTYLKDTQSEYLLDEDGNDTEVEFTSAMRTAVETYFNPIKSEITGATYPMIQLYEQIQGLNITFNLTNYTRNEFNKFLELRIKTNQESLKYFAVEEE